jgi:RNA polymerase sigma factor (sigma-70 family)
VPDLHGEDNRQVSFFRRGILVSAEVFDAAKQAELVAAIAARRDQAAFTRLFDHFAPRINAYLLRLGLDRAAAEEIAQDVLGVLWRKAALFDPQKSSLATWLYRIARNRRIDWHRRQRVMYVDPASLRLTEVADGASPAADTALDVRLREDHVHTALSILPEQQLLLIRLAFFDGLSHSEIAEKTGIPLGTVKSRIRLAFSRLRRSLEAHGVVEAS